MKTDVISLTHNDICKLAVKVYGKEEIAGLAMEEAAEFIQAVNKMSRTYTGTTPVTREQAYDNLTEEIADVLLVVTSVMTAFNIAENDVNTLVNTKAQRWLERMKGGAYGKET